MGPQVETDLKRGKHVPSTQQRCRTFADLADHYIKGVLPKKAHKKDQRHLTNRLNWWKEQIGEYLLADIAPADIAECRDRLEQTQNRYGAPLSGATVNRYLAAIGAAFTHAVKEWHGLDSSPVSNVARRGESKGRTRYLDDDDHQGQDERKKLLAACKESPNPDLYPATLLALTTGMRKGEILTLTWPQINLQRRLVRLTDTKNGESRTVPLPKVATTMLKELGKVRQLDDDRLFTAPFSFDRSWQKALAAADITDYRFHDNRHSAASFMAINGATLAELAQMLGHKTLAVVQRYSHLTEQHQQAVVDRMAEKVFGDE